MSHIPARVGTAEREVLHHLVRLQRWSARDAALYESRSFTEQLLQRLVTRGYATEHMSADPVVYRPSPAGIKWSQHHPHPH